MKKTLLFLLCALLAGLATFGSMIVLQNVKYDNTFVLDTNKGYFDTQNYQSYLTQEKYNIVEAQFEFKPQENNPRIYEFQPAYYHSPFYYEVVDANTGELIIYNENNFNRRYSADELVDVNVFDFKAETLNSEPNRMFESYNKDDIVIMMGRSVTDSDFYSQVNTFEELKYSQHLTWLSLLWIGVVFFGIILLVYHYKTAQPNWITKLPTEVVLALALSIFFIIVFGFFSLPGQFMSRTLYNFSHGLNIFDNIVFSVYIVGILSLMTLGIMMILSKIKHGRIFKDSLISKGVTGTVSLFGLLKNQTQLLIAIIALGLLHFLVIFGSRSVFLMQVLFLIDAVIIYFVLKIVQQNDLLFDHLENIREGNFEKQLDKSTFSPIFDRKIDDINHLHEGINKAVEKSLKEERMSIDLITNVSHDLKTPLTSILNYTQMIIDNENPDKHKEYLEIIKEKALRLSDLSNDVVEASKVSSGKVDIHLSEINVLELLNQVLVEHQPGFEQKNLSLLIDEQSINQMVQADSQKLYRVFENLFKNIEKYALENTRVYIEANQDNEFLVVGIKNVSATQLGSKDLTARFVQGDESRHQDGNGLGLAIAKDLMKLQGGQLNLEVEGDYFKVYLHLLKSAD